MVGQWEEEVDGQVVIRCYDERRDIIQMNRVEKSCEICHDDQTLLSTDSLGDPICRIRNSPLFTMLVAEVGNKLVGSIQGSVKPVEFYDKSVRVGYVLGLRVVPQYRRHGIGSILVRKLEEWFVSHNADYAYMATQKDNEASLGLFIGTLGYNVFRNPAILVNPVNPGGSLKLPSDIEIRMLKLKEAEPLYRRHVAATTEFFPGDIDKILRNKLSVGTWVASYKNDNIGSWAMLSVWDSSKVFKLRIKKAPLSYLLLTKVSNLFGKILSLFGLRSLPDLFNPFGFYFLYGVHAEGPLSGKLVRALCEHVHNMAASDDDGARKVVVVEVDGGSNGGDDDSLGRCIPHWKMLSCDDDMWCIKPLKCEEEMNGLSEFSKMCLRSKPRSSLFVDPRDL
ncbi:PREDICTED: probable N-acetyltransferase HLS1 [Camelina sativa]|uniref:Probable N-acetyltransferase HLS1 n=1 Tax=Camelina sativa TaxID=90675 RepID=A0ABM0Z4R6_CAMSA|nr:PREDICTED: probable N-acetyltransferase HLS1 [Camelina sativa]